MRGLCPSVIIFKANIDERSTTNHTTSNENESPLLKVIMVTWREYMTSSKERSCPNVKKDQAKWYASTKMHFDMIMPKCKLVSLRSITNERVMPQYRAIFEMTKLHYKLSQASVSWSDHLKRNPAIPMRRLCSHINTSNQITHPHLIL